MIDTVSRHYCLCWLAGEAACGPSDDAPFAREIAGAINSNSDDISTEALEWLWRMAGGRKWSHQANACLDLIDLIGRRDTEPCLPPWPVVSETPAESGVQHV